MTDDAGAGAVPSGCLADETLSSERTAELYEALVADIPFALGKELSKKERAERRLKGTPLVYGEIEYASYAAALARVRAHGGLARPGGRFVDLGSGSGKAVFAAALLHDFDAALGIELLHSLHAEALKLLERWARDVLPHLPRSKHHTAVSFKCGDFTAIDWCQGADVLFAASTCYDDALMLAIAESAARMAVGSFAVTYSAPLPSASWLVLEAEAREMSWGSPTVFIQKKIE